MPLPYSEAMMGHLRHPRNVGKIEDADARATVGSPDCGDIVTVYIKVDAETLRITDISFESRGCAANIVTGSIITELAKGKTLKDARKITWNEACREFGGLPPIKGHCVILTVDGLREAIDNYEELHSPTRRRTPTTAELVRGWLRQVINPLIGLDVVHTGILKEVNVIEGTVRVVVDLSEDHHLGSLIRECITEKLEPRWDVEQVIVEFSG